MTTTRRPKSRLLVKPTAVVRLTKRELPQVRRIFHEKLDPTTGRTVRITGVRQLYIIMCHGQLCSRRATGRNDDRHVDMMIYVRRTDAVNHADKLNALFECNDFAVFTCVEWYPLQGDATVKAREITAKSRHAQHLKRLAAERKARRDRPEFVAVEDYEPIPLWNFLKKKKPAPSFPVVKKPK